METNNISVVQKCYADFGKGDIEGVLSALTDDVKWVDPGYPDIPYAGKRNGKSEVASFFEEMNDMIEFTHFEPKTFNTDQNMVFVTGYFAGKSRKVRKAFESEWAMVWQVNGGQVASYQAYVDTNNIANALK